jgi:hypothetical protein
MPAVSVDALMDEIVLLPDEEKKSPNEWPPAPAVALALSPPAPPVRLEMARFERVLLDEELKWKADAFPPVPAFIALLLFPLDAESRVMVLFVMLLLLERTYAPKTEVPLQPSPEQAGAVALFIVVLLMSELLADELKYMPVRKDCIMQFFTVVLKELE